DVGGKLVTGTGVVFAALSFVDAAQSATMMMRAGKQGDAIASGAFKASLVLNALSGAFGVYAAYMSSAFLGATFVLGPLGIAVFLAITAYAVTKWGQAKEATPIELWARRCVFGINKGNLVSWKKTEQAGDAVATLNAALLGFSVDVGFESEWDAVSSMGDVDTVTASHQTLNYRIVMPNFDPVSSAYAYAITVIRRGGGEQVLTAGQKNMEPLACIQPPPNGKSDYEIGALAANIPKLSKSGDPKIVSGKIHLTTNSKIRNVSITARFYKDRMDEYGFAEITTQDQLQ
ncbi:hypothetical protein K8353_34200, partial [Burkholderia contaminans]|nr:hypothetical protein [Burkholderia contaminans]